MVDINSDPVAKEVVERQSHDRKQHCIDNYFAAVTLENSQGFPGYSSAQALAARPAASKEHEDESQNVCKNIAIEKDPSRGGVAGK